MRPASRIVPSAPEAIAAVAKPTATAVVEEYVLSASAWYQLPAVSLPLPSERYTRSARDKASPAVPVMSTFWPLTGTACTPSRVHSVVPGEAAEQGIFSALNLYDMPGWRKITTWPALFAI